LISCSQCNEVNAFEPLPVKAKYRLRNQKKKRKDPSKKENPREPSLAECKSCKLKVSAQHLIRRSLIDRRPNDWPDLSEKPSYELPMSIIPLTAMELENRYREEQLSRVSYEEAKLYVDDRERQFRLTEEDNSVNSDKFVKQVFHIFQKTRLFCLMNLAVLRIM
jgi:hypothetical protein